MTPLPKILVIWDSLGDYHHARINALIGLIGAENVSVACMGKLDKTYLWENSPNKAYKVHYLSQKAVHQFDFFTRIYQIIQLLKKEKITHIAQPGFARVEYLFMLFVAPLWGKKIIFFAESWYSGGAFRDRLKGLLIRGTVHKMLVSGIRAQKYYNEFCKIPLNMIESGYSVVDNEHFARKTKPLQLEHPYLLTVARYSSEKNLTTLIQAYRASALYQQWVLVLIGDGPQRTELESMVKIDADWIKLEGWKTYEQLPAWYQGARAFILPSTFEPWGLVVNEALAAGCSVLASSSCGCIEDLLGEHHPYIFEAKDQERLTNLMNQLVQEPQVLPRKPVSNVLNYSCESWASKLVSCVT